MKRFFRVLILALLAAVLSVGCFAETNDALSIQSLSVQADGSLQVLFYSSVDSSLRPEDFSLTIDNAEVPVESVSARNPEDGTSWVYLVDTASVSTNSGSEPVTMLLEQLIAEMDSADNAAIVSTGKKVEGMELVSNPDTLKSMLGSLKGNQAVTELNATVGNVLSFLENDGEAREHVCIVIISDGETSNETGMTTEALKEEIARSNATVYTVAFVAGANNQSAVEKFGSLADASCGGVDVRVTSNSKDEVPVIVSRISNNENRFRVLSCNPAAQGVSGSNVRLFLDNGSQNGFDSFSLSEADKEFINGGMVTLEPTVEPTPTPSPTPYNFMEDIIIFNLTGLEVIIAGGCILLALIILIIAIVVSSKKRRKGNDEPMVSMPVTGGVVSAAGGPPSMPVEQHTAPVGGTMPAYGGTMPAYPEPDPRPVQVRPAELNVTLTQIGSRSEGFFSATMRGQLVVGRDPRNAQLVLPSDDLKISGTHVVLRYEHGAMFAEDISRNGTLLNDVRIYHPTKLHQQDVLTLGSSRYRISWVVNS